MRTAVILVSLIAAAVAEAPYHLPRPGPQAPAFGYQPAPAPQPLRPLPQPSQSFSPSTGYNYQRPSAQPAFVPQPHYHPQPAPQPHYHPQPAPQPLPQYQPQPIPQPQYYPQPAPQPQPHYHPQPAPQPLPQFRPQPAPQPAPQPSFNPNSGYNYQQPSLLPLLIPQQPAQAIPYNPPAPQPQPFPAPQPLIPSTSYGVPQPQIAPRPIPQPAPIPSYIPPQIAPAPAPAPAQINYQQQNYQQQNYQQQSSQQGYLYSQPAQAVQQLPLQVQPQSFSSSGSSSGLSSYQADSALYSGGQAQVHREALDPVVVDKVQNIIKDSEHSSARDAGYLSLVSGVSLENAQPSVEISSFVHTAPLSSGGSSLSVSQGSGSVESTAVSAPSSDYGLPVITANQSSQSSSSGSIGFLPNTKPAAVYGPPN